MKRLLLICNEVPHYRVSVYNYLHRRFRDHAWDFSVASRALQGKNEQSLNFEFHQHEYRFSNYRKLIRHLQPDAVILHLHLRHPFFWPLIHWLKLKRIPIISWTKGANLDRIDSKLRYHLFNYVHGLSNSLVLYSGQQLPLLKRHNRKKAFAANNTVNFEDYPPVAASKEQIKQEFGIPFKKVVLFVGTMGVDGDRKRVAHLVDVFAEIERRGVGLVLVGKGMCNELKAALHSTNTCFLGEVHDAQNLQISKIFKCADLFVVPGHLGLSLNQAFYWGLPVITEDCAHPPEIQYLKSGRNGYMVPDADIGELKRKILYMLDNDEVREQFSRRAREDILRDGSIEGMFLGFKKAVEFACRTELLLPGSTPQLVPNTTSAERVASKEDHA